MRGGEGRWSRRTWTDWRGNAAGRIRPRWMRGGEGRWSRRTWTDWRGNAAGRIRPRWMRGGEGGWSWRTWTDWRGNAAGGIRTRRVWRGARRRWRWTFASDRHREGRGAMVAVQ